MPNFPGYPLATDLANATPNFDIHEQRHDLASAAFNHLQGQVTDLAAHVDALLALGFKPWTNAPGGSTSSVEPTYVNWPTGGQATCTQVKQSADSDVLILWYGSAYRNYVPAAFVSVHAIRVDGAGADHRIGVMAWNTNGEHHTIAGALRLTGIGAGSRTYGLRSAIRSGYTGAITTDGNDFNIIVALELT